MPVSIHCPVIQYPSVLRQALATSDLAGTAQELRRAAYLIESELKGRTVWMVNSTASGGGVAEMMPALITLLQEIGIDAKWAVIETSNEAFFDLTKRIHNAIHGVAVPPFTDADKHTYHAVNKICVERFRLTVRPDDIVIVHDPQPLALGHLLSSFMDVQTLWRCHIGLSEQNTYSRQAWNFLAPYLDQYQGFIFSCRDYIPEIVEDRSVKTIAPALNPFSPKNRTLDKQEIEEILKGECLAAPAERVQANGTLKPVDLTPLLQQTYLLQVSRWDALKGWKELIETFLEVAKCDKEISLVAAGPDPASVADDPEGFQVWDNLCQLYTQLSPEIQQRLWIISLPVVSRDENALIVNALQTEATIVCQNSVQEGFGLTVTEAMWKGKPVIGTRAHGIVQQITHDETGLLVSSADDDIGLMYNIERILDDETLRTSLGDNARKHILKNFLIFRQARQYLELIARRSK